MAEHADKQHKPPAPLFQPAPQQEEVIPQFAVDAADIRSLTAANPPPLKPNTILRLQSLIGNQAVQRLLIARPEMIQPQHHRRHVPERIGPPPPPPAPPPDYTGPIRVVAPLPGRHMEPEVADAAIRAALSQYLADAILEGRQITDHVNIVDQEMWDEIGLTYNSREYWIDQGHGASAAAWTDPIHQRVFIHRDREDPAVMIHEALHLYEGRASTGAALLEEGITEYFTHEVLRSMRPPVTAPEHYPEQLRLARMLVDLVGRDVVARAYFNDDVGGLIAAYRRVMFLADPDAWDAFIQAVNREDWAAARQYLTPFAY